MEIATRMFEAVREACPDLLALDEWSRYEQIVRLTGLLHDLGHAPYSHASEEMFPADNAGRPREHEDYTVAIILGSEIRQAIDDNFQTLGISAQDVVNAYSNPAALGPMGVLLQGIVAGELDADRMDYLLRDSLYAGVTYGHYDLGRLMDTLTAIQDEDGVVHLAVQNDGRHALEGFLLARYYMFLQVYLQKYRRFYDAALTKTIATLRKDNGGRYPPPEDLDAFLSLDDVWVETGTQDLSDSGNSWAQSLRHRRHWKCVAEHITGTLDEPNPAMDSAEWMDVVLRIQQQFGDQAVLHDQTRAKKFQATDPGPYISGSAEKSERPKILLKTQDGGAELVEKVSGLVRELSKQQIRIRRLYARPEEFAAVKLELVGRLAGKGVGQ